MASQGVEFAQVSFTVEGGRRLLSDVSLTVEAGTTTALLGRSGSGKTTLLRTVNALVRPTSGQVLVGGRDVAVLGMTESSVIALRRGIGYVIQEAGLFPKMSIGRNVGMALELAGRTRAEMAARVAEMLRLVGLPENMAKRYPWQLSGGQRQRVGLARALANEPEVLLMDEPFGALDPLTRAEMQTMLRELLRQVSKTALIVTHDLEEALYLADRVVLLEAGKVVADLAAGEVRGSENPAVRAYVAATHREPALTQDKEAGLSGPSGRALSLGRVSESRSGASGSSKRRDGEA
jgi:osmoprotectant transport system ATP-binding protein